MRKRIRNAFSTFLAICIFSIAPGQLPGLSLPAYAANRAAVIRGTSVNVRASASTDSAKLGALSANTSVTVTGEQRGADGMLWYSVSYAGGSGYIRSDFVKFPVSYTTDHEFESYLSSQGFPESYKNGLRQLHAEFPSWIFRAQHVGVDWNTAVNAEMEGTNSLIDKNSISSWKSIENGKFDWNTSSWPGFDGATWVGASREITAYYMDPRNFLDETYIFQFAVHSYQPATQSIEGLRSMLKGTFLEGSAATEPSWGLQSSATAETGAVSASGSADGPGSGEVFYGFSAPTEGSAEDTQSSENGQAVQSGGGSVSSGPGGVLSSGGAPGGAAAVSSGNGTAPYADIIMSAAEKSRQNPYVLAAMILQEQGAGKSGSISGASGYYNYYNVGAYATNGMTAVERGLWYASQSGSYERPWTNPERSIVGGALFFAANYLNAGQNTMYLKKWNVQGSNMYKHQYMTNVQGAAEEGAKLGSAYTAEMKQTAHEFSIPVYGNMPESPSPMPTGDGNPNNKLASLSVDGFTLTPGFQMDTNQYTLVVDPSVSYVNISARPLESHAQISGAGTVTLNESSTTVQLTVKAQNGTERQYSILINRQSGGQLPGSQTALVSGSSGNAGSSGSSTGGPGVFVVSASEASSAETTASGTAEETVEIGRAPG